MTCILHLQGIKVVLEIDVLEDLGFVGVGNEVGRRDQFGWLRSAAFGGLLAGSLLLNPDIVDAAPRFPPISDEPNRCERGFVGNTIGQVNSNSDFCVLNLYRQMLSVTKFLICANVSMLAKT